MADGKTWIRVLDEDPDLGAGIPLGERDLARRHAVASVAHLSGEWRPIEDYPRPWPMGALVLEGLILHEAVVGESRSLELLAPGCVMLPWVPRDEDLLGSRVTWRAAGSARIALLEEPFMAAATRWPSLIHGVMERAADQARRLVVDRAISHLPRVEDRVLAILWVLAERWGHVTSDGVTVPIKLTHQTMGHMVGARRPTISLAFKLLAETGDACPAPDGGWVLKGTPERFAAAPRGPAVFPGLLAGMQASRARARVRGTAPPPSRREDPAELLAHARRLRERCSHFQRITPVLHERAAEVRARSEEIRERLGRPRSAA